MTHTATYLYDAVNRLYSAAATGNVAYSQAYTFTGDGSTGQYGNMGCAPAGPGCVAFTYNPANNQIAGYTYDPAGNLINDGTNTYQWDGEGHLTSVSNASGTVSTNIYNALGQRVRDVTPTSTTDEAYGAGGELLWRYTGNSNDPTQRAFVPFNGSILAEYWSGGTIFDHPDQIGTISTATDQTGNNFQERLYHPFGEFWTGANLDSLGVHQTFAKLPDYDPETDQYNTLNRHYSPSGRWLSPDPGGLKAVHTDDPQTWNMYAYVRNDPTTNTDPSGEACVFGITLFGSLFGGKCDSDTPPPPPPPPPPAPAAATPGTPQNGLATAQANARSNPAYQPQSDPTTGARTTFCNLATCNTVESVGGPIDAITDKNGQPNLANTSAQQLPNSSQWHEVSPQEAQNLANQGVPVVGVQEHSGHGHEVTVAPELMPGLTMHLYGSPLVNNVGARVGVMAASQAFSTSQPVHYYAPNNYTPNQ